MNKKNTMTQRTTKKNKLERDLEGKPKITINPLKKTVVHVPTIEKYKTLMQVYDCGGWRWSGLGPATLYNWDMNKEETCVDVKNGFAYGSKAYSQREGEEIISIEEFHNMQKITPDMLREIKNYFETKK